jgi:hypothetical protein
MLFYKIKQLFHFKIPSRHNPSGVKIYIQRLPVSALINRSSSGHMYTGLDILRARSCPFYSFIKNYHTLNYMVLAYCGVVGRGSNLKITSCREILTSKEPTQAGQRPRPTRQNPMQSYTSRLPDKDSTIPKYSLVSSFAYHILIFGF